MKKRIWSTNRGARARCRRYARLAGVLVAGAASSWVAMAAVISLQPPDNDAVLRIPVLLAAGAGEELAGLQFDLDFDPARYTLEAVEAGDAAVEAGKDAILAEPSPGAGRVLITGFNNAAIPDGHIATVVLRDRGPDAPDSAASAGNFQASDPLGNPVPLAYENAYAYPPPEKPEKPDKTADAGPENAPDGASPSPESEQGSAMNGEEPRADLTEGDSGFSAIPGGPLSNPTSQTGATAIRRASGVVIVAPETGTAPAEPGGEVVRRHPAATRSGVARSRGRYPGPGSAGAPGGSARANTGTAAEPGSPDSPRVSGPDTLALATPGIEPVAPREMPRGAVVWPSRDGSSPAPGIRAREWGLFALFFALFTLLHRRIFRWISVRSRRARS